MAVNPGETGLTPFSDGEYKAGWLAKAGTWYGRCQAAETLAAVMENRAGVVRLRMACGSSLDEAKSAIGEDVITALTDAEAAYLAFQAKHKLGKGRFFKEGHVTLPAQVAVPANAETGADAIPAAGAIDLDITNISKRTIAQRLNRPVGAISGAVALACSFTLLDWSDDEKNAVAEADWKAANALLGRW
eukprot:140256-Amphidinium_carterae.1